ncbi:ATP-binding Cassette (ABC) Superfamily [Thraustotheca clavata]|uniref:ATP-binding Cassette (ABC) Superfamily n=1 Tax=Thraustotheca clavata TaxID=74557 RepID=A0A1W0A0C8_9STRA|nr:ATP-binding Cassette (ABC) Superfamily [Thraustotheca clavata]
MAGPTYARNTSYSKIYAAIVFSNATAINSSVDYSIRLNSASQDTPKTSISQVNKLQKALITASMRNYAISGFLALQTLVSRVFACAPTREGFCSQPKSIAIENNVLDDRFFVQVHRDIEVAHAFHNYSTIAATKGITVKDLPPASKKLLLRPLRQAPQPYFDGAIFPFPIAAYKASPFFGLLGQYISFAFAMSYAQLYAGLIVALVNEKETKTREVLKIVGVEDSSIFVSWYITYGTIFFIVSGMQAIFSHTHLFANSSFLILFTFFTLSGFAVLSFGFFVSSFFSKAKTASFIGILIFFLFFLTSDMASSTSVACLAAPVAMSVGISSLAQAEVASTGINFATISTDHNGVAFSTILLYLCIDVFLYTLLGVYFEKIIPKEYGVAEHWAFPFTWCLKNEVEQVSLLSDVEPCPNAIEEVALDLQQQETNGDALCIQHIRKVFPTQDNTEKVAISGLSLSMYRDQITCLLGHNGAGKTTLISILTGMLPATSGNAFMLRGLSLRSDLQTIRKSIGICPQHDILYDKLTVEEHLLFYSSLKGNNSIDVESVLLSLGMEEKRQTQVKNLSGGMKRKLSLIISFLGESKIIFLDEPTSGMDPYSRRQSWEMILNHRRNRILVLTTHSMEEADILGDRIAILVEGSLQCCGTSMFLKTKYGTGYKLSIELNDETEATNLIDLVTGQIPSSSVSQIIGTEVSFQLPLETASLFPDLFNVLDESQYIQSFGISVTTLEEVFIKVTTPINQAEPSKTKPEMIYPPLRLPQVSHWNRLSIQFRALFRKRYLSAKRDRKIIMFATVWPMLYIVTGIAMLMSNVTLQNEPKLYMNTSSFTLSNLTPIPFSCHQNTSEWCTQALTSPYFTDAAPIFLKNVVAPVYPTTSPVVLNVSYTDINVSDTTGYCLRTAEEIFHQRQILGQFGGYVVHGSQEENVFGYNMLVNTTSTHSSSIFKALIDQAFYRYISGNLSATMTIANHPLPMTEANKLLFTTVLSFSATTFFVLALASFSAALVPYLVTEKCQDHDAKHQQLVSGASIPIFWLANFAWDALLYIPSCGFALAAIYVNDITPFTGTDCDNCAISVFSAVIVLFIFCGLASIGFSYCISFLCKDPANAQSYIISCNVYLGLYLSLFSMVLELMPSTRDANESLVYLFRLSPLFCLSNGLNKLSLHAISSSSGNPSSAFALENAGYEIIYLVVETLLYPLLAIAIDHLLCLPAFLRWLSSDPIVEDEPYEVDHDVDAESIRVESENNVLTSKNLRKVYNDNKVGLAKLTLGLSQGECFGFLGINGAGKSTTMKILTGEILASEGSASICGFNCMNEQSEVRRHIGYCPQSDALIDYLTVREHLELFAAIKGIPSSYVNIVVMEKLSQMNLVAFESSLAKTLSGGNKRKLSVAIAMIGAPSILILDEPSTGMDPVSRRSMWDVIASVSTHRKESTIFLTTHSMEECEALCHRVGIMVSGRLRCLGSIQHLKTRFGDGLLLHSKLKPVTFNDVQQLQTATHFPSHLLSKEMISTLCQTMGHANRIHSIQLSHPTGYVLAEALEKESGVRPADFCAWWLREERFEVCYNQLQNAFGNERLSVVERHLDVCRFKLTNFKLSAVFSTLETLKDIAARRIEAMDKKTKSGGFQGLGLSPPIFKAIMAMGYKVPTPIQRKSLPHILSGKDVVAMARTGSGKTAAFLVPMLEKLKEHSKKIGVRALILSPTRELAVQTIKFAKSLAKFTDIKCGLIVGGDSLEQQFELIASNPDVLVATPGRLMHLLLEIPEFNLQAMEYVCFDEADRLFEMGFAEQLQEILSSMPPSRQTLLFSATLPQALVQFARAGLTEPELIRLDVESQISDQLKISFFTMRTEDKTAAIVYLLRDMIPANEQTIVFAATRHHVEFLHELLLACHIDSSCVYGDMDQTSRKINIGKFRAKKTPILIVTDVAARGIDIPLLNNVINYSFPATPKLFVHRVGRAARAGRSGMAFNFVDPDEMPYMVDLHLFLGRRLEDTCPADTTEGYTLADMTVEQVHYGCLPQTIIDTETECLKEILTHNSTVAPLVKVCENAYKQYSRSRAEPSKQSIKRAKEVASKKVHPLFYSLMTDSNMIQEAYLEQLKGFRPAATIFEVSTGTHSIKKNAPSVVMMKKKRRLHNEIIDKNLSKANIPQMKDPVEVDEALNPEEQEQFRAKRKEAEEAESAQAAESQITTKRYLSAADRKKLKKMKLSGEKVDVEAIWKEKELSAATEATAEKEGKQFQDEENYIGYQKEHDYAKEEALSRGADGGRGNAFAQARLEDAMLDVNPDEAVAMNNKRRLLHWDARKKKYIKTTVGELKNGALKRRNDGTQFSTKKQKVGETYKKWQQKQHKRTNIVGTEEDDDASRGPKLDYRNGKKPANLPRVNKYAKSELLGDNAIRKEEKRKARSSGDKSKMDKFKPKAKRGRGNIPGKLDIVWPIISLYKFICEFAREMASVFLGDLNDFIQPSQACVNPLFLAGKQEKKTVSMDSDIYSGIHQVAIEPDLIKSTATDTAMVSLNDCLACSGCVTSAETILISQQSAQEFRSVLATNVGKKIVVTISPQARASIATRFNLTAYSAHLKLVSYFRSLGVHVVLDSAASADIALLEARTEFLMRYRQRQTLPWKRPPSSRPISSTETEYYENNEHEEPPMHVGLPMLTSACPGWVCYAEKSNANAIPYISTTKSPQQITGTLVKRLFAPTEEVYHATIMPCYDKKLEASRNNFLNAATNTRDVDCVLAASEVLDMLSESNCELASLPEAVLSADELLWSGISKKESKLTGASEGEIGSGGYLEHIFRFAAKELFNVDIVGPLTYVQGRNSDFREVTLVVDGKEVLKFALAYGFRNIQTVLMKIKRNKCPYHFVEIMACPGGCLNGGGQVKPESAQANKALVDKVYATFRDRSLRLPNENLAVLELYKNYMDNQPCGPKAMSVFHTRYHAVPKLELANPFGIKW